MRALADALSMLLVGVPYSLWDGEVSDERKALYGFVLAGLLAAFAGLYLVGAVTG